MFLCFKYLCKFRFITFVTRRFLLFGNQVSTLDKTKSSGHVQRFRGHKDRSRLMDVFIVLELIKCIKLMFLVNRAEAGRQ